MADAQDRCAGESEGQSEWLIQEIAITAGSPAFSSFGALVQRLRTRRGLSQQALARALGVHRNTIGNWERGDKLPDSKGMVLELARQLHLEGAETRALLEASLTGLAPYWTVPYPRNPYFTGREELLEEVHRRLLPTQAIAVTQSHAMSGLGGIGKTQIAIEYAYRYAQAYAAVFWIGAETVESIITGFLHLAEVLHLPERQAADQQRVVAAAQRWLNTHKDWLLIWDNVWDLDLLQRYLPSAPAGAHLLTTRQAALGPLAQSLEVSPLAPEEGLRLLLRRAKVLSTTDSGDALQQFARRRPVEAAAAEVLVQHLEGLPLALDQAGAYVEETVGNLADYLHLYQTRRAELLNRRGSVASAHPASVMTTWSVAFESLEQSHPTAADLLRACACLHPEAIPEELFTQGAAQLGERLGPVAADPLQWQEVLGAVLAYSLIQRQGEDHTFSIHRLVQVVLQDEMDTATAQHWRERAVQAINAVFPEATSEAWRACERLLPHLLACATAIPDQDAGQAVRDGLQKAGEYLCARGQYKQAELLLQRALRLREQAVGPDHLEVAHSLYELAVLFWKKGQYEQAEPLFERALHIRGEALGPDHPEVARSLTGLASLAFRQGQYEQARSLYQRALSICEHALGPNHLLTAHELDGLAIIYAEQGQYEHAESLFRRALQITERALGPTHPEVCPRLNNLAYLYQGQGKLEHAEPLFQRALGIWEQALGPNHPAVTAILDGLATLYTKQEKYAQAEPLFQRALHIREEALGPDNLHVATVLDGLATLYCKQEQWERAEPLYQRALAIREQQHLGLNHPDTARCLLHLGTLYRVQGRGAEALSVLHRALAIYEHTLGPEHPDTARCLQELATLEVMQGHVAEAERRY